MPYRRPGVEVVQEFQALTPALVLPTLPAHVIGPAYQVQGYTDAGAYAGVAKDFSYPSKYAGAVVDIASLDDDEIAETQKPVNVKLSGAYVTIDSGSDGVTVIGDQTFTAASSPFTDITPSATVHYYVQITTAGADLGKHLITSKTSGTSVELADEMQTAVGANNYKVLRYDAEIEYDNSTFATVGITLSTAVVSVPSNLPSDPDDASSYPVSEADKTYISYRALRPDLADAVNVFTDLDSLEAIFGVGSVVPSNPYAYGINIALNNTTTEVSGSGLRATFYSDESAAYQTALEYVESKDVYALVILTQTPAIHQLLNSHVTGQSVSTVGRERIGFINRKLSTYSVEVPASGIGTVTSAGTDNGTSAAHVNTTFKDPTNGSFITDGVATGYFLEISSYTATPGNVRSISTNAGDSIAAPHTVTMVNGAFTAADVGRTITIAGATTPGNDGAKVIATVVSGTVITVVETMTNDPNGFTAIVSELAPSAAQDTYIKTTRHLIDSVDSNTKLTLNSDPTNGFYGKLSAVVYRITDDLTRAEEATFLAGYATSFGNRRLVSVWPDKCAMTVSGIETLLPGFYFGCALVGLVAGLPSQQGFTNLGLTGFVGLADSGDRYTDTQLDTIAGGGNCVIVQDVAGAPVYIRHQLTTDTSTIQFQELSITKNVDLISRFFRKLYQPYIGKYNITDALMDVLKSITVAGVDFLKNQKAPRAGGVIRDGSIASMGEDPLQPDTVNINIDVNIPYPLNHIKVTILV